MLKTGFNVLLNVFLVGSFVLFVGTLFWAALRPTSPMERFLRVAAIFGGALVTLGAAASGATFASFTASSLAEGRPASAAAHLGSAVIPGLLGAGLGFYVTRTINRGGYRAIRVMCFVGSLAVSAFIGVYIASLNLQGLLLGPNAVPNVAFVVGVILTVVFTQKGEDETDSQPGLVQQAFRRWMTRDTRSESTSASRPGVQGAVDPFQAD